ncbi:acyl-CoA dehydrogenase, N-terminal domain protein [Mycobacterium xenopi 3993]|nr:acyl-CoA dehydrogenase, N-terminal domain protein [Mycobacterium xenopi 3993]
MSAGSGNALVRPWPPDFSGVWKQLAADLGVAGLLVPEELGGAGAGAREAAVVMEEIGRAVARCHICPARCSPPSRCCRPATPKPCRA